MPISAGSYRVRLHFAECWHTVAGARLFNVSINGTQVLTNFDIVADAGAANRATIKEFTASPVNGKITVTFTTAVAGREDAVVGGIEVVPGTPP